MLYKIILQNTITYMVDVEATTEEEATKIAQENKENWVEIDTDIFVYDAGVIH